VKPPRCPLLPYLRVRCSVSHGRNLDHPRAKPLIGIPGRNACCTVMLCTPTWAALKSEINRGLPWFCWDMNRSLVKTEYEESQIDKHPAANTILGHGWLLQPHHPAEHAKNGSKQVAPQLVLSRDLVTALCFSSVPSSVGALCTPSRLRPCVVMADHSASSHRFPSMAWCHRAEGGLPLVRAASWL
jgi:hypothetical protein